MTHLIYINDNNLLIQKGAVTKRSQGYAWLKGDEVVFDSDSSRAPVKHCRLAPQDINSRYWQQCDESSVANNSAGMRHAADLIWRHLGELQRQHNIDTAVLIVPSHYRQSNLQLLLGVAKSSNITVTGLVNKAVLALHDKVVDDGQYNHLDVQLHQTVSTTLTVTDGVISLGAVDIIQDVGVHAMQEALLKGLQQNFIQNDRFDPLHDAATEQQLFDQLPDLMQQINESGKASVSVQHQGRLHSSNLDAKNWNAFLNPFVIKILAVGRSAQSQQVFVDLNAAFLAALPQALESKSLTLLSGVSSAPSELLQHSEGGAVVYLAKLPTVKSVKKSRKPEPLMAASVSPSDSLRDSATHLLLSGKAIEIANASITTQANTLSIGHGDGNVASMLSAGDLYILNDEGRQKILPNDRLGSHIADGVITVIQVC